MADGVVGSLLENLKQLLLDHISLISNAEDQVKELNNDLRPLQAFLRDPTKKRMNDEGLRQLHRQIRGVVYDAKDFIGAFVSNANMKSKNFFLTACYPTKEYSIDIEVKKIRAKIRGIYGDVGMLYIASLGVGDDESEVVIFCTFGLIDIKNWILKLEFVIKFGGGYLV